MTNTEQSSMTMWPDLIRSMDNQDGVFPVTMETLRLLEGAQRLGPNVLKAIDDRLRTLGIGYLPVELPGRGDDTVVLYRQGTLASEVIRAVTQGMKTGMADSAVIALRKLNETPKAEDVMPAREVAQKANEAVKILEGLLSSTSLAY